MSTINYTYNVIVDRFRQFAAGHFQLRRFTHGEISQADLEKEAEWPWLHVKPRAINYSPGTRSFSFEIFISDLPRDKEDKTGYQAESITDCSLIFQDLINDIYLGNMFGDQVVLSRPVNSEPFVEQYTHTLTGVTGIIELSLDYDWSACSIPASWNYNTPTDSPSDGWGALQFIESLDQNGVFVSLLNDEEAPGNSYYYGTDAEGVKGWYAIVDNIGLTCETLPDCAVIISIEDDIAALQTDVALKANTADLGATAFSNSYNDLDDKPTIPAAQVNSDWNATSGVAEILNKPTIPTATSDLTNDGEDGVNPFITAQDLPDTSGFVPYTGATQNVDLGTHTLSAKDLVINHSSGSGVAASITKGGAGEALTVNKTSGSGNAMSVTGGVTQLSELHLTTDLADAYIASAATWNAKVPETRTLTINGTTQDLSANRTFTIATGLTVGTTPITSGTVGRVLFEGTGNVLQESANLFWDNTNSRLGIGTASPLNTLDVAGTVRLLSGSSSLTLNNATFSELAYGTTNYFRANGSSAIVQGPQILFLVAAIERARIFATTGNVGIGTTTDAGFKLDVNGSTRANSIFFGAGLPSVLSVDPTTALTNITIAGTSVRIGDNVGSTISGYQTYVTSPGIADRQYISGEGGVMMLGSTLGFSRTFSPTSGTGVFNILRLSSTINQTGGASGVTRGLYINPILTAAANFRAIEWSNNTGWGLYGAGTANNYMAGSLGIGALTLSNYALNVGKNITGSVVSVGIGVTSAVLSDVTNTAHYYLSSASTQAATFTLGTLNHYVATQGAFGLNSTVNNQHGFFAGASLIGAGSNFGFRGQIPSGSNRWNLYMDGTALNYLNGNVLIGTTTDAGFRLDVNGTARVSGALRADSSLLVNGTSINGSAIAQFDSGTRGLLPPRMTTTQKNAIATPAAGLVVYDTTLNKLCVRGAAAWETITSV